MDDKEDQSQSMKLEADPMPTCLWGPGYCCHWHHSASAHPSGVHPEGGLPVLAWPALSLLEAASTTVGWVSMCSSGKELAIGEGSGLPGTP